MAFIATIFCPLGGSSLVMTNTQEGEGTPIQHAIELCTQYGIERKKGLEKIRAIFTEKLTRDKILKDKQKHMQSQSSYAKSRSRETNDTFV